MTRTDLKTLAVFAAVMTAVVGCANKPDAPSSAPAESVTEAAKVNAEAKANVQGARDDLARAKAALK